MRDKMPRSILWYGLVYTVLTINNIKSLPLSVKTSILCLLERVRAKIEDLETRPLATLVPEKKTSDNIYL